MQGKTLILFEDFNLSIWLSDILIKCLLQINPRLFRVVYSYNWLFVSYQRTKLKRKLGSFYMFIHALGSLYISTWVMNPLAHALVVSGLGGNRAWFYYTALGGNRREFTVLLLGRYDVVSTACVYVLYQIKQVIFGLHCCIGIYALYLYCRCICICRMVYRLGINWTWMLRWFRQVSLTWKPQLKREDSCYRLFSPNPATRTMM